MRCSMRVALGAGVTGVAVSYSGDVAHFGAVLVSQQQQHLEKEAHEPVICFPAEDSQLFHDWMPLTSRNGFDREPGEKFDWAAKS